MQLNTDQLAAVDMLSAPHPLSTLIGYAGTGKSTTLVAWLRTCDTRRVILTAPTNKAVSVLRQM